MSASALRANPFFILELPVSAGPREVEREAQRLLGMLELGLAAAATYSTPMGPMTRRAEDVRAAAAALRDPRRRLVAELWAAPFDIAAPSLREEATAQGERYARTDPSAGTGTDSGPFDNAGAPLREAPAAQGERYARPQDGAGAGSGPGSGPFDNAGAPLREAPAAQGERYARPQGGAGAGPGWPDALGLAGWGRR